MMAKTPKIKRFIIRQLGRKGALRADLARHMGVSRQALYAKLNNPSWTTEDLAIVAEFLDTTIVGILEGSGIK